MWLWGEGGVMWLWGEGGLCGSGEKGGYVALGRRGVMWLWGEGGLCGSGEKGGYVALGRRGVMWPWGNGFMWLWEEGESEAFLLLCGSGKKGLKGEVGLCGSEGGRMWLWGEKGYVGLAEVDVAEVMKKEALGRRGGSGEKGWLWGEGVALEGIVCGSGEKRVMWLRLWKRRLWGEGDCGLCGSGE